MNDPAKIRNIALVGHRGTGKTSLFEALLFGAGAVTRLGSVADGTTVSDWDDDEKKRQMSLSAGLAQVDHGGLSYNLVDTPGDSSFLADAIASLEVVETALMVVNTVLGVEVQTERLWDRAAERGLARMLVCNMLDRERADFDAAVAALQEAFGAQVVAVQLPIGSEHDFSGVVDLLSMKAYTYADGKGSEGEVPAELADAAAAAREKLIDAVASTDDDLAEKYLMEEEITADELNAAFAAAVATAQIFPVACVAATAGIGADRLFDVLALAPSPADVPARAVLDGEDSVELACDPSRPAVAFVFKTLADPFSGHVNVFRVFQGTMNSDSQLVVARDGHKERVGQLLRPRGKENKPVDALVAGDIGAVAKLKDVVTGDTLTAEAGAGAFPPIRFPAPLMSFAITAKSKGEEDKVISALRRLSEEDPMLEVHRDEQTGETIVGGMSQVHVEVTVERMKRRFGVEVELKPPRVPYRETIKGTAKAEGKHKKQTGGRGQFADTWMQVSPRPRGEGFEFVDKIVGGAIPRNFIPAVEKGVAAAMAEGFLAGYPVVDVEVQLYDGKHHPVDSSDMAFQIAGSIGFKAAVEKAQPVLLEPIMNVEITVPEENVGDIIGDLNARRGRVLGTTPRGHNNVVGAEVPLAEMLTYAPDLTSMTGGRGDYHMELLRYDEVPAHLTAKIVEQARQEKEDAQKS
ncbi:MAG TPA: elongation factor G [Thermoleophilia bacterium]|nr:elongation factor G [Actinomycetota bacterium]HQH21570.1 elongation factor G [Thermoleophilia bacterium]